MKSTEKLSAILLVLLFSAAGAAQAKKLKGEDISNMIIEGENRLQVHAPPSEYNWPVDVYKDVPATLRDPSILGALKSPSISQPPITIPKMSLSEKTASPWYNEIYEPPIITMKLRGGDEKKKAQWAFLVKDSHGNVFYQQKKRGALPPELVWSGVGSGGHLLKVGYDYSYSLSIIDEAGNPQREAGKPFRLNSFRYNKGLKTITSVNPDVLFADRSSLKFSNGGFGTLTEVKDHLRSHYGQKIEVVTYDDDQKFALARSKAVGDFLAKSLDIPPSRITPQGYPQRQGDGYKHVDIIAK